MKQESTSPRRLSASLKAVVRKVSTTRTADFFTTKRNEADNDAALRILRREGGQPPAAEDAMP